MLLSQFYTYCYYLIPSVSCHVTNDMIHWVLNNSKRCKIEKKSILSGGKKRFAMYSREGDITVTCMLHIIMCLQHPCAQFV